MKPGPGPQAELAAWRAAAMALVTSVAKQATKLGRELRDIEPKELLGESICTGKSMAKSIVELGDHLTAMPEAQADAELLEAAQELLEVAVLRGDSTLPSPPDDPKDHSARMQTAWDDLVAAVDHTPLTKAEKGAAG